MTIHVLKCWPEPFEAVLSGRKKAEIRHDDRGFEVGDLLCLQEWEPGTMTYTGRELSRRVSDITRSAGPVRFLDGLVVLSLEDPQGLGDLQAEQARLQALLHQVAELLGVKPAFGAVEEEPLLTAAKRLAVKAGEDTRLAVVLDLIRQAHGTVLMGSAPAAKANLGEAARLLAALIDGRE